MVGWTTEGDFLGVVDTLEEVTILRKCAAEETLIAGAWRFNEITQGIEETEGAVSHVTSEWQLPIVSGVAAPNVSDRLLDSNGNCWTLVKVERLRGETRYRCLTRRVLIRSDAAEWIDIERAIWEQVELEGVTTLRIADWIPERQALRGHLWRISTSSSGQSEETLSNRFRIAFTEPVEVTPHHRIRTHAGEVYRVTNHSDNHRLGDIWMVDLEQMQTASAA